MLIKQARKGETTLTPEVADTLKARIANKDNATKASVGKARGLAEKFGKLSTGKKAGILGAAAAALAGTAYAAKKLGKKEK